MSYVHLLLPKHPVIQAEGVWVESFFPGPVGLAALTLAAKAELFVRFPHFARIRSKPGAERADGPLALRGVRRWELDLLLDGRVRVRSGGQGAGAAGAALSAAAVNDLAFPWHRGSCPPGVTKPSIPRLLDTTRRPGQRSAP